MFLRLPGNTSEERHHENEERFASRSDVGAYGGDVSIERIGMGEPIGEPLLDEPLEVCDQGSFFVGGVPKVTKYAAGPTAGDAQQITIGQAYVQFQVPKTRRQWPIVFVHGSSHTGAAANVVCEICEASRRRSRSPPGR